MLTQSKLPPKALTKTMLSVNAFEDNNGWNAFDVQIPSESATGEIPVLRNLKVSKYYARGSVLFIEGQEPCGIYVLREGRAKVSIASTDGRTLVLRIAVPGDLLGMNATLSGRAYGATVETLERCRIDFIAREDILKLLDCDKRACLDVAHALSSKLREVVEHSRLLFLSHSAAEKLARLLVRWCDDHGKNTPQGIRIDSSLTHEEIAQMICASRETVTRVLGEFKRQNIVSLVDNAIFIHNREALESMAFC
jgi:CRP/FNR family transcriptional regulator